MLFFKAFDLGAADYLLKPYDEERVHLALERILHRMEGAGEAPKPAGSRESGKKLERIPALQSGKTVLVDLTEKGVAANRGFQEFYTRFNSEQGADITFGQYAVFIEVLQKLEAFFSSVMKEGR